jgi:hypothetical protein
VQPKNAPAACAGRLLEREVSENPDILNSITIGAPGNYRIIVGGRVDESWSGCLAGMRITAQLDQSLGSVTALEGRVSDQAELIGVLDSLYDMQHPILSVELQPAE